MGKTLYLIGEAFENEEGGTQNTFSGDQSGFELHARKWYEHTPIWGKVYRFNNASVAEEIASRMEQAILNGYVGYDTNHRHTFLNELKKVNFDIAAVHDNCGTDCSALAYTAVYGTTGVEYDYRTAQYPEIFPALNQQSPKVRQFDHYIERQCVNAGYDITVFTLDTTVAEATSGTVTVAFKDGTIKHYIEPYYNTPYDYYDSCADSNNVRDHLHVVYLNKPNEFDYDETFLSTLFLTNKEGEPKESAWQRGDIIRTLCVKKDEDKYTGHIGVWL